MPGTIQSPLLGILTHLTSQHFYRVAIIFPFYRQRNGGTKELTYPRTHN